MPSKNGAYNVISDDIYDCRIPLHSELAFQHGIHFQTKVRAQNCLKVRPNKGQTNKTNVTNVASCPSYMFVYLSI